MGRLVDDCREIGEVFSAAKSFRDVLAHGDLVSKEREPRVPVEQQPDQHLLGERPRMPPVRYTPEVPDVPADKHEVRKGAPRKLA